MLKVKFVPALSIEERTSLIVLDDVTEHKETTEVFINEHVDSDTVSEVYVGNVMLM